MRRIGIILLSTLFMSCNNPEKKPNITVEQSMNQPSKFI